MKQRIKIQNSARHLNFLGSHKIIFLPTNSTSKTLSPNSQLDLTAKARTTPTTSILFAKVIFAWTDCGIGDGALFITIILFL